MLIKYSAFILPHIGDKYQQCADRFSYNETNQCFAIADGVGNSLFPSEWSQLLCDDFVKHPTSFIEEDHLQREDELIKEWEKQREVKITNLSEDEKFIFEVGLEKADFAASTFVGLSLDKSGWNCQAIGDSYLFLVDEKYNITKKVASMDGHDFDNFPEYFASKKGQNNGKVVNTAGDYNNVAYFALMTDALSDWFLEASQEKRKELLNLSNHKDYEIFIDQERQKMILKDDDTTLLILRIEHNDNENLEFQSSPDRLDDINNLIKEEKTFEGMNNPKDESKVGILLMDNNKESVETFQNKEQERKEIEESLKKIKFEHPNYTPKEKTNCIVKLIGFIDKLLYGTSD